MISLLSIAIVCLILIPTVPLVLYCIGLLLPSSHIVTRSAVYDTSADILWTILTSVKDYPAWRTNIEFVTVDGDDEENGDLPDLNKYQDQLTFVEYTKKNHRKTVVTHVELAPNKKLLRVLQEAPPTLNERGAIVRSKPTFSGSWTFELKPLSEEQVELKITEQGEINKPMVRVSHQLFFGYYRRIDRFIKDLSKEVEFSVNATPMEDAIAAAERQELEEEDAMKANGLGPVFEEEEEEEEESDHEAGPDESLIDTNSTNETKDWDMMSEMYERPHAVN